VNFVFDPSRGLTSKAKGLSVALRRECVPYLAKLFPVWGFQRESLFPRLTDDRGGRTVDPGKAARADERHAALLIGDDGGQIQMLQKRQEIVTLLGGDGERPSQ